MLQYINIKSSLFDACLKWNVQCYTDSAKSLIYDVIIIDILIIKEYTLPNT